MPTLEYFPNLSPGIGSRLRAAADVSSTAVRSHLKVREQGSGLPPPPEPGHRSIVENTMSSDSDLKKAVLDELNWEPSVNAAHTA